MKKEQDVSVSQRQIYILSLLSENPNGFQAEEIRQRLLGWDIDVSKRTISRDIDELSLHYAISEEERGGKTYYFADKYTLKNVDFTISDLASLAFAREMLKDYAHFEMGKHAIELIYKMIEKTGSLNRLQFEAMCKQFGKGGQISGGEDAVDPEMEKELQQAIENHNKVEMEYYSYSSDSTSTRIIHPYRLIIMDSYLCVEGYCEKRQEIRRFRVSRIERLEVLDDRFEQTERPEDPFLQLAGGKKETLELCFTGEAVRYIREYEKNRARRLEEKADGLHFYQEAAIAPDVIRWIRGFGPEVEVIEPKWLRERMKQEQEMIAGLYR